MQKTIKLIAVAAFVTFSLVSLVSRGETQTRVETAGQKFKSIQVLNDMPADQMGKVMNMMSASLGVDCKFCHTSNDGDYEKEGVKHKDTARKMIQMVFDLNKTHFEGRPEINCNTCHNGKPRPASNFPLGGSTFRDVRLSHPPKTPSADEVIARYLRALGGPDKLTARRTRLIKANRIEPDGKISATETIRLSGGSYRSDTAYGKYIVTELFSNDSGRKFGGSSEIELKPDEAEHIRREGELFYPLNFKSIYPKMEFLSLEKINGRDTYVFAVTTDGGLREKVAFDTKTGLLMRRSSSAPTVFGDFVYKVEYSDYREAGGIKMPFTTHYAVPNISWTRKITSVKYVATMSSQLFDLPDSKE